MRWSKHPRLHTIRSCSAALFGTRMKSSSPRKPQSQDHIKSRIHSNTSISNVRPLTTFHRLMDTKKSIHRLISLISLHPTSIAFKGIRVQRSQTSFISVRRKTPWHHYITVKCHTSNNHQYSIIIKVSKHGILICVSSSFPLYFPIALPKSISVGYHTLQESDYT